MNDTDHVVGALILLVLLVVVGFLIVPTEVMLTICIVALLVPIPMMGAMFLLGFVVGKIRKYMKG